MKNIIFREINLGYTFNITFTLFLLWQIVQPLNAQQQVLSFKNITQRQGLSDNRITAILQDENGILWMGSKIAINSYDGDKIETYQLGRDNNVNQIINSHHKIIAATSKGLFIHNPSKNIFEKVKLKDTIGENILSIAETPDGRLLVSDNSGNLLKLSLSIYGKNHEYKTNFITSPLIQGQNITSIYKSPSDTLFLGTNKGDVFTYYHDEIGKTSFEQTLLKKTILDITSNQHNKLWIATAGNGLYEYNISGKTRHFYRDNEFEPHQTINNNMVLSLFCDDKDNVWVGTDGGGLNVYQHSSGKFNYFTRTSNDTHSIADNSILSINKGANNSIILGTVHGGVSIFRHSLPLKNVPSDVLNFPNKDQQSSIIYEDSKNNIWLSAGREGLRRYNPTSKRITTFTGNSKKLKKLNLKGNIILSLLEDTKERLWIGTLRGGLNIYDIAHERFIDPPSKSKLNSIYALEMDKENNVWVGHRAGISIYNSKLELIDTLLDSNLKASNNVVNALYKDVKNDIWVGTTNGLFRYKNYGTQYSKERFSFEEKDSLSLKEDHILSIGESEDLSIIIGTYGHGAYKFNRTTGKIEILNKKIEGSIIRGILKANNGDLWLSTNMGLSIIRNNKVINLNDNDGIQGFNGGAAYLGKSGYIYLAGSHGLSFLNTSLPKFQYSAPIPHFTFAKAVSQNSNREFHSFQLNFPQNKNPKEIHLAPKNIIFNINFSSSDLYSNDNVQYAYLMEGLDTDWQYIGNQNFISFSNLKPGKYTLKVKSSIKTDVKNANITALNIIVPPSFFEKKVTKISLFFLIALIVTGTYLWRISEIKKQKKKLQTLLNKEIAKVKEQEEKVNKNKIAILEMEKKHQKLIRNKLEADLIFREKELTNNTLRAISKNDLLKQIKDILTKEVKNSVIDRSTIKELIGHINDNFVLDKEWENFYKLFNTVHPSFISKLRECFPKLTDRDIKLCALIRLKFLSRHIATLLGISISSVKVARHRLRKKLNLDKNKDIYIFLKELTK